MGSPEGLPFRSAGLSNFSEDDLRCTFPLKTTISLNNSRTVIKTSAHHSYDPDSDRPILTYTNVGSADWKLVDT